MSTKKYCVVNTFLGSREYIGIVQAVFDDDGDAIAYRNDRREVPHTIIVGPYSEKEWVRASDHEDEVYFETTGRRVSMT